MPYLVWAFIGLILTSLTGALLFFGFALFGPPARRARNGVVPMRSRTLPLNVVTLHVILSTLTLGLLTVAMVQGGFF